MPCGSLRTLFWLVWKAAGMNMGGGGPSEEKEKKIAQKKDAFSCVEIFSTESTWEFYLLINVYIVILWGKFFFFIKIESTFTLTR